MKKSNNLKVWLSAAVMATATVFAAAQSNFPAEDFTAIAMVNDNFSSGAGTVMMQITRWSSEAERDRLVKALVDKGSDNLLRELERAPTVGIIKTPDSLGYDLHFAYQRPGEDGGRDIVIATDRPIGFWEARNRPRVFDYPFTVIQMHINRDGTGKGTMSYATKIQVVKNTIELENFSSAPIMLTEVKAKLHGTS